MEPTVVAKMCLDWDGSSAEFAAIVAAALRDSGLTQRDLAREFEVADSTVSRWSNGVARPHPLIQKLIVKSIQRRAERQARALTSSEARTGQLTAEARQEVLRAKRGVI